MKVSLTICALVPATAFTTPMKNFRQHCTFRAVVDPQEHLKGVAIKWEQLKTKEKEILSMNDPEATMDLAVEMVETAIEHIQTQEEVEEEHISLLQATLRKVIDTEDSLEAAAKVARNDAVDAHEILQNYEIGKFSEDFEKRRELAVSDLSINVENYVEERIHQAKAEEQNLRDEEEEAGKELRKLKWNEDMLKDTLKELRTLQKEKEQRT